MRCFLEDVKSVFNEQRNSELFYRMIYFSCSIAEGPFLGAWGQERGSKKGVKMVY